MRVLLVLIVYGFGVSSALAAEDLVAMDKFFGREYTSFGTMCYTYPETEPSEGEAFKCRRSLDALYVDGLIESVMMDEMVLWSVANYKFPGQLPLKKLHLNSKGGLMFDHGGSSATAVDIIEFVKDKKIETYAGAECKSACVPIFTSGLKRQALETTDFMVHSPRLSGAHLIFLKDKCGKNLEAVSCKAELEEIRRIQQSDMDLYFDLIEVNGVSLNLRKDYSSGGKDLKAPGNGNLIAIEDLYFDGLEALGYGVALELLNE